MRQLFAIAALSAAAPPVAAQDFDADGIEDLVIGSPMATVGMAPQAGMVHLLWGAAAPAPAASLNLDGAILGPGIGAGDQVGGALSWGDYDNDGTLDLAIGSPGAPSAFAPAVGAVLVAFGPWAGGPAWVMSVLRPGGGVANDHLGSALASGDFNNDGFDDLAVGIPDDDTFAANAGAVIIYYGAAAPFAGWNWVFDPAPVANDRFGTALAAGAIDAGAADDLVVAAPWQDVGGVADAGTVSMYTGGVGFVVKRTHPGYLAGDHFGATLAVSNFNGDPYNDLAVGIPDDDVAGLVDAGSVMMLHSNGATLVLVGRWHQNAGLPNVVEANDHFGAALAAGDVDLDGDDDLIVGVPYEDLAAGADVGMVHVLRGTAGMGAGGGITGAGTLVRTEPAAARAPDDKFGASVACGDYQPGGILEIAVGAPEEDYVAGGLADVGRLFLFPNSGAGSVNWLSGAFAGVAMAANDRFASVLDQP